jgi:hypothetical protein
MRIVKIDLAYGQYRPPGGSHPAQIEIRSCKNSPEWISQGILRLFSPLKFHLALLAFQLASSGCWPSRSGPRCSDAMQAIVMAPRMGPRTAQSASVWQLKLKRKLHSAGGPYSGDSCWHVSCLEVPAFEAPTSTQFLIPSLPFLFPAYFTRVGLPARPQDVETHPCVLSHDGGHMLAARQKTDIPPRECPAQKQQERPS